MFKRLIAGALLTLMFAGTAIAASSSKTFWTYDDETDVLSTDEFLFGSSTRAGLANITWEALILEMISDGSVITTTDAEEYLDNDSVGVSVQAYDTDIATAAASQAEAEAGTETSPRAWSPLNVFYAVGGYLETYYGHSTPLAAEPTGEWVGQIALADNSSWDPASITGTTPYYCVCTATGTPGDWTAFLSSDGSIIVASIEILEYIPASLSDTSSPHSLTTSELKGTILTNYSATASTTFTAPTAAAGWNFTVQTMAAYNIVIDPDGAEQWYLNGAQLAAGENIQNTNPTVGESIVCFSAQSGSSTYSVFCESKYADWAEETP